MAITAVQVRRWRREVEGKAQALRLSRNLTRYRNDPVGYARDVLGLNPWHAQEEIARLLLTPPYRVLVRASAAVGKTWLSAWLVSWFYDTRPRHTGIITTAPTRQHVEDVLWGEIRQQRAAVDLPTPAGSRVARMKDADDHWAVGYTADKAESFRGRHPRHMMFVFDEANGVEAPFWSSTKSMFQSNGEHYWIAIFNPVSVACPTYAEELAQDDQGRPLWHTYQISSLDHPNLAAGLRGEPEPYPGAVGLSQFVDHLYEWCDPVQEGERGPDDLQWPPEEYRKPDEPPRWYRPGPEMQGLALGCYPTQDTDAVWSEVAWRAALADPGREPCVAVLPEIGCDVANKGKNFTEIHVQWDGISLHHEYHNGWTSPRIAARLKELCEEWAAKLNARRDKNAEPVKPVQIPVKIDADGIGVTVVDLKG